MKRFIEYDYQKTSWHKCKIVFIILIALILSAPNQTKACTSVCLAKNGHVVFGNNLDWYVPDGYIFINKRNVKKRGLWFDNPPEWISKYASITVNQEGREFPSRGMNEAGLVIGEMTLRVTEYPDPDSRYVLNPLQWMQYILDNCATVADVLATDKEIRIDKNEYHSHFFICDSTGDCVVMEWLEGKLVAHTYNEVPIKVLANSTYDYCLEHGNDPAGRFGKAAGMLDAYTSEDPVEYMFLILQNVSQQSTKWSLVFDTKKLRLYYKTALNREIRHVSLHDFDLRCSTDVYMINVNGIGSGNMTGKFVTYTRELNAQLTRSTFRQLEPQFGPFTEETLNKIISYPETTGCQKNIGEKIHVFGGSNGLPD
jgi:penicillin V acylase-like amidase (Ntn superfamily)